MHYPSALTGEAVAAQCVRIAAQADSALLRLLGKLRSGSSWREAQPTENQPTSGQLGGGSASVPAPVHAAALP